MQKTVTVTRANVTGGKWIWPKVGQAKLTDEKDLTPKTGQTISDMPSEVTPIADNTKLRNRQGYGGY